MGIAVVRASVFGSSLNPSSGQWSTPIRYVDLPSAVLPLISLLAILLFGWSMTAG